MKKRIAKHTLKLRHRIVKMLMPSLYQDTLRAISISNTVQATPRPMILFLKEYLKETNLTGAEIGVAYGDNAVSILELLPMRKLFLIDPYVPYMENNRLVTHEEEEQQAKKKLSHYPQVTWLRKTSDQARRDINETLDFVYIDGNHSYEYTKKDIANYYPLIRSGGVIGGHDYKAFFHPGIEKAVDEFAAERGRLKLHAVFPDWWFIK